MGGFSSESDIMSLTSAFEQTYRCYPAAFIEKAHLEKGDKVIMPPSALDRLANLQIDYPMLFEVSNPTSGKTTHCGVLEFIADEGMIYFPYWMMENMLLNEGDIVNIKNASLSKGTFVRLQPHTKDFLDFGDTIMVAYNNGKFYIDIVETKPSPAISIIETDREVDFAPPLDYQEPEKPSKILISKKRQPEDQAQEEPANKIPKFSAFTGSSRRLDGKPSTKSVVAAYSSLLKHHEPEANSTSGSTPSISTSRRRSGKLVFGSNGDQASHGTPKIETKPKESSQEEQPQKGEESKFKAFTGKKYSLKE